LQKDALPQRLPGFLLLAMLLHDGAGSDLFGALAVAAGALGRFFDVFVLPLFFRAGTAKVTFYCHVFSFA
jgi:hypothetical protein